MFVEFWNVGAQAAFNLPMTSQDICSHLLTDWIPSIPSNVSSSFVGWPPFLINTISLNGIDFLTLQKETGRSERQWKGVLSWMLGIAGTRQVLGYEGYRWIAPLSAFYPEAKQEVDISTWPVIFPRSSITAEGLPGSPPNSSPILRPDYIALRPLSGGQGNLSIEWAVAESKGTDLCLTNRQTCPPRWYDQARNVLVCVNGFPISIPRYLVIATRVNPNAKKNITRRIQIRAWNSANDVELPALPPEAAVDIATSHLFGFFRCIHFRETARALAVSVRRRTWNRHQPSGSSQRQTLDIVKERALEEMNKRTRSRYQENNLSSTVASVQTDLGEIEIEIASPTILLVQKLLNAENDQVAVNALQEADHQLDEREKNLKVDTRRRHRPSTLSFGVQVFLPDNLDLT